MKNLSLLVWALFALCRISSAQTIYVENFGTGTSLPPAWNYSQTINLQVVNNTNSAGYIIPVPSGGSNLLIGECGNTSETVITTDPISTVGKTNIVVAFGYRKTNAFDGPISFEYSINSGGSWTAVPGFVFGGSTTWASTGLLSLPAGAAGIPDLQFRFRYTSNSGSGCTTSSPNYRIDDFTVGENGVLPVQLILFTAQAEGADIVLHWITASEHKNAFFALEHSADGVRFTEIGQVEVKGRTDFQQQYAFTHSKPGKGSHFYRLRQVDSDGKFAYSPLVSASLGLTGDLRLSPMPTTENLRVQLDEATTEVLVWQVFDNTGRQVRFGKEVAEIQVFDLNVTDLAEGFYTLRVISGQKAMTKRFQKKQAF